MHTSVEAQTMPGYRVSFYKNLLSSDGHSFKCLQQQIDVPESDDVDHAAETASKLFATLHGMRDWKLYADSVEVAPADIAQQLRVRERARPVAR
jgi:hypothetical protein